MGTARASLGSVGVVARLGHAKVDVVHDAFEDEEEELLFLLEVA